LNFNLSSYWTGNPNDIQNVWYDSYTGATDNSTLKDTSDYSQYIDTCKSGNITGLVSCWNFNEGYGTTANDRGNYSVNGNDGTLTNMNTGIDNGTSGWTQSGKFGGGVMIDYTLQSINCGNDSTLKPLDQITFMGWFKPTRHEDYQRYMSMHADNDYYGYGIKELAGNKFNLVMDINGVSNTATSNSDSVLNQWVHLVGSYNGTGLNLYVDGILQDDTEAATGDIRYNEFDFVIGNRHTSSRAMHGTIDEVKIYNRALSQSEITAEYNLKKDYFNAMPNEEGGITASSNWDIFLTNGTTDIPPTIEIQQPPATNTTINWFNISAYDINEISSCWFSLGATANYTLTNSSGNWNYQNSSLIESDYTVTFYCNDSLGNEKSTDRYFTYDLTDPFVKIHEPTNISYATTTLDLNYTSTDINRDTTWYEYNGTNTTLSGNTTFTALDDQQSNLTLWANDSTGNTNSTTVFFKVDTTEPLLTINTPTEDQNISDTDRIDFNVSYVELYPDTCILVFDSINYSMTIDTTNKECTVTLGNIADGTYPYYVWMNDTVGNDNQTSGSATITYTASWYERISGSGGGVPVSITQPIIIPDNLTAIEPTEISRIIAPATVGTGSFTIYNLDTISKRYTVSFDCSGYNDTLCNYIYLHDPILSGLTNALSIDIAGLSNKSIDYQLSIPKDINQTVFNADILITPDSDESLTLPVTYTTITKITILNFIQDYKYLLAGFTIFILVLLYFSNNDKRGRFD
ncbi:MAG: LamG domain-containing protein, partial [Candidatus Peribacteraceae bacterium]|nr:LamG domain-containing protein [Candidatus Peribacteraceae bacterium]